MSHIQHSYLRMILLSLLVTVLPTYVGAERFFLHEAAVNLDVPFRKKNNIRSFKTNISDFSEAEIKEWMDDVRNNAQLLPPMKSDKYVSSLIDRILDNKGVTRLEDEICGGVRRVILSIERGNAPDIVAIEYALYQPDVAYVTTAMYPFAGESYMYNQYCMFLESDFPFLQMGARPFARELPGIGMYQEDSFAIRTIVPLVGAEDDYKHLWGATKCLPIYGYDTRDGFPTMNMQPYAGRTGLNIQLEKLMDIYKSRSVTGALSTEVLLFGPTDAISTEVGEPACAKLDILREAATNGDERFMGDNPVGISFITIDSCPTLWMAFSTKFYKVETQETIKDILTFLGEFSFPSFKEPDIPGIMFLKSWISVKEDDVVGVNYGMVGCCPNEIDIKVMAWQIARFQSLIADL